MSKKEKNLKNVDEHSIESFKDEIQKQLESIPDNLRNRYVIEFEFQERATSVDAKEMTITQDPAKAFIRFIPYNQGGQNGV